MHGRPEAPASAPKEEGGAVFPIVGIGMSAGGLEAATEFLNAMPADSGAAFVIVQHLEPTRNSLLADLLGRQTTMPVMQIEDGMRVEPNNVYVIVPAKTLVIRGGILRLTEPTEPRGQRHPIDTFFTALAEDQTSKAIAIVLSGAGSNGTAGLQDIRLAGGIGIAQEVATARFDSMPGHAIASGGVDYILAPAQMPEVLLRYFRHPYVDAPLLEAPARREGAALGDVLALLRVRGGHDFRQYKRNSLSRRTHRRMGLANIEHLDDYMAVLRQDPTEIAALTKDLMINVTGFFRDPEAWEALDREVIAPLIERADGSRTIRAWVPACSTGEEAYTIAMLLVERIEASGKELGAKIFATDPADHNLSHGRKGVFPGSMVESLPAKRLSRFFDKVGDNYRVKPSIREMVLFAPQNLLQDPPYSKMDLVSCRNLLIYLESEAQERVLSLAHFALREGGYLFLGNAETIGQRDHLFATVSKRWRIYRRTGPPRSSAIDFAVWPSRETPGPSTPPPKIADIMLRALAERFAPASVLIDRNYRVLHFHGATGDYLLQPPGAPTLDLLTLAREGLPLTIRRAVQRSIERTGTVTLGAGGNRGAKAGLVSVTASPAGADESGGLTLVSFAKGQDTAPAASARAPEESADPSFARDFEEELKTAREELQATVEQFETANEELKAANEEITSVNEELQSTNEELESSKEELQSLNEELNAVNSQLERKVIELEKAGDDLRNLLAGNEVATVFLDTAMRITWFTPGIRTLFDLIDQDIGRPIANFTQKFADGGLLEKAEAAVRHLASFEEEVRADNGRWYLLRVLPYRTSDNRIAGASATFIDITDLKATQAQIADARDYAETIVQTVRDPLLVLNADLTVRSANRAFYALFRTSEAETLGRNAIALAGRRLKPELRAMLENVIPGHGRANDVEVEFELPRIGLRCILLNARRVDGNDRSPARILLAMEDITERRDVARHQETLVGELSHRVKNTLAVVQSIAAQTLRRSATLERFGDAFQGRLQALGRAHDAVVEGNWRGLGLRRVVEQALKPFQSAERIVYEDGADVELAPQATVALVMILHELATNASKYGALSTPSGQVLISVQVEGAGTEQRIAFHWKEAGGPPVMPPSHRGHGTSFVERSVAYELQGEAKIEFKPEGLRVSISFPVASPSDSSDPVPASIRRRP